MNYRVLILLNLANCNTQYKKKITKNCDRDKEKQYTRNEKKNPKK